MAFLSHTRAGCTSAPVRRITLLDLIALRRQRLHLSRLSDAALSDIGHSRRESDAEAKRGFLDIPENWGK